MKVHALMVSARSATAWSVAETGAGQRLIQPLPQAVLDQPGAQSLRGFLRGKSKQGPSVTCGRHVALTQHTEEPASTL